MLVKPNPLGLAANPHKARFQGRSSFSQVWSASGTFGQGGDSGAWVFDNEQGRICGHVLAYSERFQIAYISPMEVTLEVSAWGEIRAARSGCFGWLANTQPIGYTHHARRKISGAAWR